MARIDIERIELRDFTVSVQAVAARSLGLLRDIESTLTWLERMVGQLRTDALFAAKMREGIEDIGGVLDPDGELETDLWTAQTSVGDLCNLLKEKRNSARSDRQLTDEDGIDEAYTDAISHAADLHNAIDELRFEIGVHDGMLSPSTGPATADVDELFARIGL